MSLDMEMGLAVADVEEVIAHLEERVLEIAMNMQSGRKTADAALAMAVGDPEMERQAHCLWVVVACEIAGQGAMVKRMREGIDALRGDVAKAGAAVAAAGGRAQ